MPCLVKADGTIIAPTAETWKIRNDSTQPVTLDTAAAETITPGTSITAKSQPATLYENDTQDGKGSYTIAIDDTGNETKAEGGTDEHPVQIAPGESLGFDWDVQLPIHLLNFAPPQPITVADISMTFKTIRKTAFAVYSEDDHSLDFYKRIRIPQVGETLNGKTVTNIYTGFETETYYCTKAGTQYGTYYEDDAVINTPWYGKRLDIKTVEVVDDGIKPYSVQFWFSNLHNCTSLKLNRLNTSQCASLFCTFNRCKSAIDIEISNWNVSNVTGMVETFLECHALQNLDLSGWTTSSNLNLHSTWNNCYRLTSLDFGNGWSTARVKDFACTFWATAFDKLDLSSWNFDKAENVSGMFGFMKELREIDISSLTSKTGLILKASTDKSMFNSTTNISRITVGDGLVWNDIRDTQNEATPSPVSPSGKWYSTTSGKAYDSADLPDRTADTYVSDTALLPMKAFAVYSIDDGSFNFYKRRICDIPSTGDTFEGKNVTNLYMGFEEDAYTGAWPNDDCPWFSIATKVKSVTVVDAIRPKSMAWWFNQFAACTSFDLGNVNTSKCVSFRRLFSTCASCLSITGLDRWDTSSVVDLSATFDGTYKLKTIPGISCWNTSKVKYFAMAFYNLDSLEQLDLSNWDDSSMMPDTWVDEIGYSKIIVGNGGGNMKSFKSFSIGAKWSHTSNLARSIEQASGGTAPTDGKWHAASDGTAYESTAVPSNIADIYYATPTNLQSAIVKEPADWTLDDQQAVAKDISDKGETSLAYVKAKAAMDARTTWSIGLTDGNTMTYRIIGINHDDLADGSGKAELTFLTTSTGITSHMNSMTGMFDVGGWEKSELRQKMNSGKIWNLMPSNFQSKVKSVRKLTGNVKERLPEVPDEPGATDPVPEEPTVSVTATSDKLFLLSYSEIVPTSYWASDYPWTSSEGTQYEAFKGKVTKNYDANLAIAIGDVWWERSLGPSSPQNDDTFFIVDEEGSPMFVNHATVSHCVCHAWCF